MSLADTNSGFLIIPLKTNKHFLVALKKGQIIHQIGFLNILPIFGLVNIDGFTLPLKKTQQILTSDWMPARCISAGNFDIKISSKSLQKILKEIEGVQTSTIDATFNGIGESQIGSVFIAECYEPTLIEWMVEAEDCVVHTADTESTASNKNSKQWRTATELVVGKGLLATKEVLDFLKIDLFEIKPTWRTALGGLLGTLRLQSVNETDMKVVICGAKGSGKSSVVRCTVNRFLSVSSQVCVIDCDVGQPEFSVPGLVSLYVISEPILAPCHLNLRTPELSVFVGDVTPKNSPYMIEQAVKALYERYLTLSNAKKDEYKKQNGKPSSSSSSSSTKNIFDALTDDTDTHSASNRHKYLLPLVVNIDGYTRYMGAEILSSILSTVQPTHICHICTEKDMELPPVEQYLAAKGSSKSSSCELYKLEPGSMSPGKVSATDLRTLRYIYIYFILFYTYIYTYSFNYLLAQFIDWYLIFCALAILCGGELVTW